MSDVDDYFRGKPETHEIYRAIERRIEILGPSRRTVRSQISFGVSRKFAWFWLYNITKKNPSGVLHLMLALDHEVEDPRIRDVSRIGERRWNHQIVIRTMDVARSEWLADLLQQAYRYGAG